MTRPNIALLCLDTLRADAYAELAPRLRDKADVNVDTCRAAASWSVPSHGSMFTGKLPREHHCHSHDRDFGKLDVSDTFLSNLSGYDKRGVSANVFAGPVYNFSDLFDEYRAVSPSRRYHEGMDAEEFIRNRESENYNRYIEFLKAAYAHPNTTKTLLNGALLKLDDAFRRLPVPKLFDFGGKVVAEQVKKQFADASGPTFLFANFMDVHEPHENIVGFNDELHDAENTWSSRNFDGWDLNNANGLPPEFEQDIESHRGLYDASVEYTDRVVSDLIDELMSMSDRPLHVVVTADHGENLAYDDGEPQLIGHSASLNEGLLRVPLSIFNSPESVSLSGNWVSHLDLGRIITSLSRGNLEVPERGVVPSEIIGSGIGTPDTNSEYWERAIRAAVKGEEKFVWDSDGGAQAYKITTDLDYNTTEVKTVLPAWATDCFNESIGEYKRKSERKEARVDVDESTAERLENLGYR